MIGDLSRCCLGSGRCETREITGAEDSERRGRGFSAKKRLGSPMIESVSDEVLQLTDLMR